MSKHFCENGLIILHSCHDSVLERSYRRLDPAGSEPESSERTLIWKHHEGCGSFCPELITGGVVVMVVAVVGEIYS